jgi:hypothetical protein
VKQISTFALLITSTLFIMNAFAGGIKISVYNRYEGLSALLVTFNNAEEREQFVGTLPDNILPYIRNNQPNSFSIDTPSNRTERTAAVLRLLHGFDPFTNDVIEEMNRLFGASLPLNGTVSRTETPPGTPPSGDWELVNPTPNGQTSDT